MENEKLSSANNVVQMSSGANLASHSLSQEHTLSKNKLRKIRKYNKRLEFRQTKRSLEKVKRKEKNCSKEIVTPRKFRGNDEKLEAIERLKDGLINGPKVVIDCHYENCMSEKEKKRFAQQIRRAYSSNRVVEKPLHLYLTSLREESQFFQICTQQNAGFSQYIVDITAKSVAELFSDNCNELIYLSPDAKTELEEFNSDKIYVIGGIVDETTSKNISQKFAEGQKISTARIPIDKYFSKSESGTYKQVLTINQVVDIILEWHQTKDWVKAISAGLPKRTGFVPDQ